MRLAKTAIAITALASAMAHAVCVNGGPSGVNGVVYVTGTNEVCNATQPIANPSATSVTYSGNNVAYATGQGVVLNFTKQDTTITTAAGNVYALAVGGSNGGPRIPNATVNAQNLTVNMTSSNSSSRGIFFYPDSVVNPADPTGTSFLPNKLNISGNLMGNVRSAASFFQSVPASQGPDLGTVDVAGTTTVTVATKANILRMGGGIVNFQQAAVFDSSAVTGGASTQISMAGTTATTFLNFNNTLTAKVAGTGNLVVDQSSGTLTVQGKADLNSKDATAVAVSGTGITKLNGADSVIATTNTANAPALQMGGTGTFTASGPIEVKAPSAGTAISYVGATNAYVTMTDAKVTAAANVFKSDTASTGANFIGHGGSFIGISDNNQGQGNLNIALDQRALWKLTGDSGLTQLKLSSLAVLDASGALSPSIVVTGNAINDGGLVTLTQSNPQPINMLRFNGSYTANGGTLQLDTKLGSEATAQSDILMASSVVAGTSPTVIDIHPTADSMGAATSAEGILVVQVTSGAAGSAPGAFTLAAPVVHNGVHYALVRDAGNGNWYLRTVPSGQLTVSKVVNAPAGAPPFSGAIPFTVTCANPAATFNDTIAVSSNQGSSAPITVPQGSTCTVQEGALPAAPTGYQWGTPNYQQPATPMPGNGVQAATITNSLVKDAPVITQPQTVPTLGAFALMCLSFLLACSAWLHRQRLHAGR